MTWKAHFYKIRGRNGYVHARCFDSYYQNQGRRDAQDRIVSGPEIDAMLDDLGDVTGECLHCGRALASANEHAALTLTRSKSAMRTRLLVALNYGGLTDRKLFGAGEFDFENRRLIGANGLALQWQTRPEPDEPEGPHNPQTVNGYVFLCCPTTGQALQCSTSV